MKFHISFSLQWLPWLVTLRIGTGIVLFFSLLACWHDLPLLYHPWNSLVHADLLSLVEEGPMPAIGHWLTLIHHHTAIPIQSLITAVCLFYLGSCLLLAVGWAARPAAFALLLLHHAIYIAMPAYSYGMDYLAMTAIACCCFAPETKYYRGNQVALHTLQFVLCFVYFMGGYDKFGASWLMGDAPWKALHLPGYTGIAYPILACLPSAPPLWAVVGTAVVLLEITYPITIWFSRLRTWILTGIIAMHLSIAVFMGLYFFSAMMIVLNTAAFIAPYHYSLRSAAHPIHLPFGSRRAFTPDPAGKPPKPPLAS